MKANIETFLALMAGLATVLGFFARYLSSLLNKKKEDVELRFELTTCKNKIAELEKEMSEIRKVTERIPVIEERIKHIEH